MGILGERRSSRIRVIGPSARAASGRPLVFLDRGSSSAGCTSTLRGFVVKLNMGGDRLVCASRPLRGIPVSGGVCSCLERQVGGGMFVVFLFSGRCLGDPTYVGRVNTT